MTRTANPGGPRTVAIEARAFSHPQPGGFKRYTAGLVEHLPAGQDTLSYLLFLDRPAEIPALAGRADVTVQVLPRRVPFLSVPWRENVVLPYQLAARQVDLVHFPNASAAIWSPCPFVITIHDVIELMPQFRLSGGFSVRRTLMHLYNRYNLAFAARRAAAILTVSHSSKRDILRYLRIAEERVQVIYEAPDKAFARIHDKAALWALRSRLGLEQDFVLGIGSADPRKNLRALIRAYGQLEPALVEKYQLVIVLTHERFREATLALVEELGLGKRVRLLSAVPNSDLIWLYNGAAAFVFPSLYEGFGLPLLEAMACGAPVVAANNSSIPEVAGDAAVLVDDVNPQGSLADFSKAMQRVLTDEALRACLRERGQARAKLFSWETCARATENVYARVLGFEA